MCPKGRGSSKLSGGTMIRKCYITEKFFVNPEEWGLYKCYFCDFRGFLTGNWKEEEEIRTRITTTLIYICLKCQSERK